MASAGRRRLIVGGLAAAVLGATGAPAWARLAWAGGSRRSGGARACPDFGFRAAAVVFGA